MGERKMFKETKEWIKIFVRNKWDLEDPYPLTPHQKNKTKNKTKRKKEWKKKREKSIIQRNTIRETNEKKRMNINV